MKENLIAYIEKTKEMNAVSLNDLKSFLLKYPFCQTARILFLKNAKNIDNDQFQRELPISSLFIANKSKLFLQLNDISTEKEMPTEEKVSDPVKEMKEQVDILSFEDHDEDQAISITIENDKMVNSDENPDLLDLEEGNQKNETVQKSLIENFIQTNPRITPSDSKEPNKDISLGSIVETDGIYTEKLAQIYVIQKNYIKAIEVYTKLSLKIPEKNTYFAEQIEKLKKEI